MNRGIPLAALVALSALVAWWLLRDGEDPAPPAAIVPEQITTQVADQAASEREATPAATAAPEATRIAPAAAIAQPPIPADALWLEVLVVDGATDRPVAGAEVLWTTTSMYVPAAERGQENWDPDGVARRCGWHTRADTNGRARVAGDANGATVHALHGGHYGTAHIGGKQPVPPAGWRIELVTDLTLRVLVLDAVDQPAAGISVAIHAADTETVKRPQTRIGSPRLTSSQGIAEFRHLQRWLPPNRIDAAIRLLLRAVASLPSLDAAEATFGLDAIPSEPIVLRLPPTGRLIAQLRHEGRPVTAGVHFLAINADAGMVERHDASLGVGPGAPCGADGWGHLPPVPLGRSFTVFARWSDTVIETTTIGPVRAGEEVRVELVTADIITILGRLLGPLDQPLANAEVGVSFDIEGARVAGARFTTDAAGRFTCQLTRSTLARAPLRKMLLTHARHNEPLLRATVPPREVVVGRNDFGDIRFNTGPLVVAGRVVVAPPDPGTYATLSVEELAEARGADGKERWEPQRTLITSQYPDGTFEVRGEAKPARRRLRVTGRIVPPPPLEFRTGESDLTITVTTGSGMSANCLVPAGMRDLPLRGVLRPAGTPPTDDELRRQLQHHFTSSGTAADDGSEAINLRWQLLPAGTYTLDLEVLGLQAPLATVPDLVVPQPTPGDPRLTDIDLRGRIRRLTVVAKADSGPPSAGELTLAFVLPQPDPRKWNGFSGAGEEVTVFCPPGPTELQVLRAGFRPARIVAGEGTTTIRLEPWPSLELRFSNLPELPDGVTLRGRLSDVDAVDEPDFQTMTTGGSLASMRPMRRFEVKNGRATPAPGEGTFELALVLTSNGKHRPLRSITPLRVVGSVNQAPIVVQLDADEVRTALAELAASSTK
ncbi:MAG: hypothetical protein MUC36_13580 [Planctomycetes bacterium]|jgi:hypothetical protein|nr:hypothetical protein [Planctomycetota bacterium]